MNKEYLIKKISKNKKELNTNVDNFFTFLLQMKHNFIIIPPISLILPHILLQTFTYPIFQ